MPEDRGSPASLVRTFRNLVAVPSAHYDPLFARSVREAFTRFPPDVVALEYPESVRVELSWARACWPTPVVSRSDPWFFPFIPGDSMFEGYRLAMSAGIPVALVDLDGAHGTLPNILSLGPDLARLGSTYLQAQERLFAASGPPGDLNLAREAHMARLLAELLAERARVLWIGGMYHWSRLVSRLGNGDFEGPVLETIEQRSFQRMRLAPTALHRMSGRVPRQVSRYAAHPDTYDESDTLREMALEALPVPETPQSMMVATAGAAPNAWEEPVQGTPVDVARTLLYARNLAATADIRERPDFVEVLTAAASCVDGFYAGRVYALAMQEDLSIESATLPVLSWERRDDVSGFMCGDEWILDVPWHGDNGQGLSVSLLTLDEIEQREDPLLNLPAGSSEDRRYWGMMPWEEDDYGRFIDYVLRRATISNPDDAVSAPFMTGLQDGLDVRSTISHWYTGTIYVKQERRSRSNFTNGAIDWINAGEHSYMLQGVTEGGWIDPSSTKLGSVSRETRDYVVVKEEPFHLQIDFREFSFITLDAPNWIKGRDHESYYGRVIRRLVNIQRTDDDNLYGWLNIVFEFCAGKPFAYYSRYIPSPRICRIAQHHDVDLVHVPLQRIPATLLRKYQSFRFFQMTRSQWEEVHRRAAEGGSVWGRKAL